MTTYFITRHTGALQWAVAHNISFDVHLTHLDNLDALTQGDIVIGTLPIHMVHQINQLGVRYWHLSIEIPPSLRGAELNAEQLNDCHATLEEFVVQKIT